MVVKTHYVKLATLVWQPLVVSLMGDDYREVPQYGKIFTKKLRLSGLFLIPLQFQSIADQLFQSFNSSISVTSFDTLSSCIISWL